MKKSHTSIDGFIPKRSGNELGSNRPIESREDIFNMERKLNPVSKDALNKSQKPQSLGIARSDIDESLRDIDDAADEPVKKKLTRKQRRRIKKMSKKPKSKAKRIIKWLAIILVIAILAAGGYLAYKFIITGGNIFQGNIFDLFQSQPLKEDKNGRSNFLILGTSEDDNGHPGSNLTDSIMVLSVNQKKKNAYMFSVPRDLYVQFGTACVSGYAGKINEYFSCSDSGTTKQAEQNRLSKTQKLVGDIFGLDIQYGVHVNHTVIKQAVDAVGGVDVNVVGSNGAPGVLDRNFDWRCNYTCYLVKYNNGVHHLDGAHALYLSMARGDVAPTYGLANSNFDREKNQQKILIALQSKAMSTGTLTDFSKITKLLDALGDNLRSNIQVKEIRTLMQVASDTKQNNIHTISLINTDDPEKSVVKTGSYGGMSVVMPAEGIFDYSGIQAFIRKNINNDPVTKEAAPVVVLNGTGVTGYAQSKADELAKVGFNITGVDNAPSGDYGKVEIYQIGSGNSATAAKLASIYKVTAKKTKPPIVVDESVAFVIIFGVTS